MKVGTDGVLLGAWAEGGRRILDIGTGTGLIALMMAQRFAEACITAIDIDTTACQQAAKNVATSPFSQRIETLNISLQEYSKTASSDTDEAVRFDAIVSNPPFFENSLRSPDGRRSAARHTDTLPFPDLFNGVSQLLSDDGVFSVIIPAEKMEVFCANSYLSGFYISRKYMIKTTPCKPAKRCLLAFRKHLPESLEQREVHLQNEDGNRSEWYCDLTADFYLR
jgi:tRNA1Val (adenine37-N6)-methyltransferase